MFSSFPLVRLPPWYPGQMGVRGSDVPLGVRVDPQAIVLYVDDEHGLASDNNDGTNPDAPMATVQAAVTKLATLQTNLGVSLVGSVIVVGAEMTISESVTIPATAPKGCTLMGNGSGAWSPTWVSAAANTPCLSVYQENWRITGFTFKPPATSSAIYLSWTASTNGSGTVIDKCNFNGEYSGRYGVYLYGAPYNVTISNCDFREILDGTQTGFAIYSGLTPTATPLEIKILNNVFWECDNFIGGSHGYNMCIISGNLFKAGAAGGIPTVLKIDLRGGSQGKNLVCNNVFADADYSNVGGYYDSAAGAGVWIGNFSPDVAEAEVEADGLVILPPT